MPQTMTKTSVKFRKNRHQTRKSCAHKVPATLVGTEGRTDGRKAEYYTAVICPSAFLRKGGGQKRKIKLNLRTCSSHRIGRNRN